MRQIVYLGCIVTIALCLRLYKLGQVPVSLHGDEVGVGYNAYSLLKTGKDEYGNSWPLVFRADVPPLLFYATTLSIATFGRTDFAIRFPSVIIGTLTVLMAYFLIQELLRSKNKYLSQNLTLVISLITSLLIAISPWHIQLSRIAHDANYALLIQFLALYLFYKAANTNRSIFLIFSLLLFGMSFYSYHSPRLTSPLLLLTLFWHFRKQIKKWMPALTLGIALMGIIVLPFLVNTLSKPFGQTRFGGINIFIGESINPTSLIFLPRKFFFNYLNQIHPKYLWWDTSSLRYFNVFHAGLLYPVFLPFLLIGLIRIRRFGLGKLPYVWLIIAILPGSLTWGTPNAGRNNLLFPLVEFVTAVGIWEFFNYLKRHSFTKQVVVKTCLGLAVSIQTGYFLYQYFIDSPTRFLNEWQYGVKEIAQTVVAHEDSFKKIVISGAIKQAYIYILFYGKKEPQWLMEASNKKRHPFIGYSAFNTYEFRTINWSQDSYFENILLVGTSDEIPSTANNLITEIPNQLTGDPMIRMVKL